MANKGTPYERAVAKQLSLWWSDGEDDFIFWRSNTSGAMSTVRARKGKQTEGHCGDLTNVNKKGRAFIAKITPELKRGKHRNATIQDFIDRGPKQKKPQMIEQFINQAVTASRRAKAPYWMVIFRRDARQSIVIFPVRLKTALGKLGLFPYSEVLASIRGAGTYMRVCVTTLDSFLANVTPRMIKRL